VEKYGDERPMSAAEGNAVLRFLDLAGHDLRNPIAVMKSQVQLLQRRFEREERAAADIEDLARIAYQIERLRSGLDTFLEAARIGQGRFALMAERCDLTAIARRTVKTYQVASRAHRITLQTPEEPIVARWDSMRVELVLATLLSNALRYSSGGDVRVVLTREPTVARVTVTDSGVGIPPGEEEAIFGEYATGSNTENSGAGLGLYVVRTIVRGHGGDIGVTSPADAGASFWFTLPLAGIAAISLGL
jgi:two-component system, OmpR family, sensor histidine kinase VicK